MFLYRFVRRRRRRRSRRRRPQTFIHPITFEQLFGFLSFWHDCWPWPIDYLIRFWSIFVVTITLNFQGQIWNLLYLSQNFSIATKRKANISIELWASNATIGFDLDLDHDLEFSRSNMEFVISQPKTAWLPRNKKQTYWLNSRPQMWPWVWPWPWPWPWVFKVKYGIYYISIKIDPKVRCKDLQDSDLGDFWVSACRRLI